MNTTQKLLMGATFLVASITVTPAPALAVVEEEQQLYECVTTTRRISTYHQAADGTITVSESISITTVCTPISN
ncbi:MAG TPA: hypothetical protein VK399_11485 [Longimicrobiaceae bacterium]|jgi:hypothetical protein|nr:hypothetical protein [Longimicrobiaceae bacterium]